jgi:hypothetical protein
MQRYMRMVSDPRPVWLEVVPIASLRIEFLRPDIRQLVLVKLQHLLQGVKVARHGFAEFNRQFDIL